MADSLKNLVGLPAEQLTLDLAAGDDMMSVYAAEALVASEAMGDGGMNDMLRSLHSYTVTVNDDAGSYVCGFGAPDVLPIDKAQTPKRMITIRHNGDYSQDTVEVLDGTRQLGLYEYTELNPHKLAEVLRWFGHPVRLVDYMFEHDIAEFG